MIYKGNAVSEGIAIGKVMLYQPFVPRVEEGRILKEFAGHSMEQLKAVLAKSRQELHTILDSLEKAGNDKYMIFQAHLDILEDEVILGDIADSIKNDCYNPDWAIFQIYNKYISKLEESREALIRERAADLRDVRNRLLRNWNGIEECSLDRLKEPVIVVAYDLLPSDTAAMDKSKVLAIITEAGSRTSHTAIIARSYEIPAIVSLRGALMLFKEEELVVADAIDGEIRTDLEEKELEHYRNKRSEYLRTVAETRQYIDKPANTKEGRHIDIGLNIGGLDDSIQINPGQADLVGLFRTEFMYMNSDTLPTEEQQRKVYKKVLLTFRNKPVVLRTLDVGGDKTLPCLSLPKEDNPFLGKRALRLCFDRIDLFKTQLRAALKASVFGDLWIMFPMVGSLDDIRKAKGILEEVKKELRAEGTAFKETVKVGIMIEIPSIAIIAEKAAGEVDFASIGTNDLCQYLLAADRINPEVGSYYQSYHPALFSLIGHVAAKFGEAGKPICVCGELGGDELAAPVLVGLGIGKLSMGISSVARIKRCLSGLTMEQMRTYADAVREMDTSAEVEAYLRKVLKPS